MDDMPELVGARPKTQAARERARRQLERTRSNSRGRTMHTRRTRATAAGQNLRSFAFETVTEEVEFQFHYEILVSIYIFSHEI